MNADPDTRERARRRFVAAAKLNGGVVRLGDSTALAFARALTGPAEGIPETLGDGYQLHPEFRDAVRRCLEELVNDPSVRIEVVPDGAALDRGASHVVGARRPHPKLSPTERRLLRWRPCSMCCARTWLSPIARRLVEQGAKVLCQECADTAFVEAPPP